MNKEMESYSKATKEHEVQHQRADCEVEKVTLF